MAQKSLSMSLKLQLEERDQAGQVVARYVASGDNGRIDVVIPQNSKSYIKVLLSAFLPAGYPQSVTKDYLEYQIYDSLQAFSSSIAGLLASRAVLEGVGVGDASASPTAAILLSILQDSLGRIATILFAHKVGTALEPECKMFRLAADFFNDAAMILDCVSPAFPKSSRVLLLSSSSALRALCGVAGSSSKASLSAHFATRGNLAELNAKDSSQETVISLLGMIVGSLVVARVMSHSATWLTLLFLISIHLWTNYKAVRAVQMRTINRQRANIVFSSYLQSLNEAGPFEKGLKFWPKTGQRVQRYDMNFRLPSPEEVSIKERIFEFDGIIRWHDTAIMGYCSIGVPIKDILDTFSPLVRHQTTGSYNAIGTKGGGNDVNHEEALENTLENLLAIFKDEQYILSYSFNKSKLSKFACPRFLTVLKDGSDTVAQVKSWFHAFLCARKLYISPELIQRLPLAMMRETLDEVGEYWPQVHASLCEAEWDLDVGALETRSGVRVCVESEIKRQ